MVRSEKKGRKSWNWKSSLVRARGLRLELGLGVTVRARGWG